MEEPRIPKEIMVLLIEKETIWMDHFIIYLEDDILPQDIREACKLITKVTRYCLIRDKLHCSSTAPPYYAWDLEKLKE